MMSGDSPADAVVLFLGAMVLCFAAIRIMSLLLNPAPKSQQAKTR